MTGKKTLGLIISVLFVIIGVSLLVSKEDDREPITIEQHASYVLMSLDELIDTSDLIAIGNLDTVNKSRWNTPNGRRPDGNPAKAITPDLVIFTDLDFGITRILKGDPKQNNARIRTLGGEVEGDRMISHDIVPEKDKTYLLFLRLDKSGSTANIDPGHYWITGGGFQGLYEITGDRAISSADERALEDLIIYIQNALDTKPVP
ncbi:MAG: hypothetical protein ACOYZ6_17335 [Chloroflexota bacterium]